MRIGIFTETYTPYISGLVTSEVMLKKALEKMGHTVYVVTANLESYRYEYDEKEKVLKIPGIPTGIYDSRLTSIYPIKAVNKIKSWKLDVIHSQTEFAIGTFARLFAKQFNIPIVHTYHTMYEDYIHYITKGHFDYSGKKIVEYLTKFYCDKTITELIVPTQKAYKLFKEKYNVARNIHIVPTGIDTTRFYRENVPVKAVVSMRKKYNITKKDFIVIFVGRIAEEKNIPFLIDVMEIIKNKKLNIKLLIVGDGPDKENYEKLVTDKNLNEYIIFTGKVPYDEMPIYYQMADGFVTASQSETQGLTVIEAMGASLPIICINDESFNNVVINDLNGYLFETREECAEDLEKIYKDHKLYNNLASGARNSADQHSAKYFAQRVFDVYEVAIKNRHVSLRETIGNWFRGKLWKK